MQIHTVGEMPDVGFTHEKITDYTRGMSAMAQNAAIFKQDAVSLCDVLFDTLPGGTLDQLLVEMLTRKASQFVVRF